MAAMSEQVSTVRLARRRRYPPTAARPSNCAASPSGFPELSRQRYPLDVLPAGSHCPAWRERRGKSTLIGILAGLAARTGTICVHGRPGQDRLAPRKPRSRHRHCFSAHAARSEPYGAEKPHVGESSWRPLQRRPALERFRELSALLGVSIHADAPVARLALANNSRSRSCTPFGAERACSFSTNRPRC